MLEPEVVPQGLVEDLDGEDHESPALVADGRARAARAHLVVVGHVDVEDELLLLRLELGVVPRDGGLGGVDGADVDLDGVALLQLGLELLQVREAQVAQVDVVLERRG